MSATKKPGTLSHQEKVGACNAIDHQAHEISKAATTRMQSNASNGTEETLGEKVAARTETGIGQDVHPLLEDSPGQQSDTSHEEASTSTQGKSPNSSKIPNGQPDVHSGGQLNGQPRAPRMKDEKQPVLSAPRPSRIAEAQRVPGSENPGSNRRDKATSKSIVNHEKPEETEDCCVHCILACLFCEFLSLCNLMCSCATCGACDDACCTGVGEDCGDDCSCDCDCGLLEGCCDSADCLEICFECCGICISS
uniref:Zgc:113363 n=1 Tax=Eptatretus burgeri TaxID=7764 RepID=A0A8C4QCD8_EPTBU